MSEQSIGFQRDDSVDLLNIVSYDTKEFCILKMNKNEEYENVYHVVPSGQFLMESTVKVFVPVI